MYAKAKNRSEGKCLGKRISSPLGIQIDGVQKVEASPRKPEPSDQCT